ncbi:MAG: PEP-CTERM sorting domain-containing protein [Methylophilaceae bacterium]
MKKTFSLIALKIALIAGALSASTAFANPIPTLTAEGIKLGFTLDTVVSGLPGNSNGFAVLGSAINSDGNIIVNDAFNTTNYVFKNVNNQMATDAISSAAFSGFPSAFAYANGSVWASSVNGDLARLNNDGSIFQIYSGITASPGLWTNPVTHHLIAGNLYDIDVSGALPIETFIHSFSADGIVVSLDGKLVYGSSGDILDLATKSIIGNFGYVSGADGMGIINSANADLNGDIIVNTTGGKIVLVDSVTFVQTIIAIGGGYGDFTSPDYTSGTLLLSSSNNLLRLGCGKSCGISSAPVLPPSVPEPASLALVLIGMFGLIANRRRI